MLARCLESLKTQIADDFNYVVLVVMNGPWNEHTAAVIVSAHRSTSTPIYSVHVPERGISQARNAVLEYALEIEADQIAFIDDDAVADADWLSQLMHPDYRDTPVLYGRNVYEYPSPLPPWVFPSTKPFVEGKLRETAATHNVRFSIDLVRAGLRFDEHLGLVGGEDNCFFRAATRAGFQIRQTARAVTRETAHPERLTYRGQVWRSYWCAAANARDEMSVWLICKAAVGLVDGVLLTAWSPIILPFSMRRFRRAALRGGKRVAKNAGRFAALFGCLPKPYRVIQGN
jgi:succinoglycan biosynthesis protein ExoM